MTKRDDFPKRTVEMLGKRVAYICSNPTCRIVTIAPHSKADLAKVIGIAAHITAASAGGPRFDPYMSDIDRKSIENGIYLCSNCACMIDKDAEQYTIELLRQWKNKAENEARQQLGKVPQNALEAAPFLEPDLIWESAGMWHRGYGEQIINPHRPLRQDELNARWELKWHFRIAVYNNSGRMAKNIRIEQTEKQFLRFDHLEKVNNLPPYAHRDLNGRYVEYFEGNAYQAHEIIKNQIPANFEGWQLLISYKNEYGTPYQTISTVLNGELTTIRKE